jgi:hypothetical protein
LDDVSRGPAGIIERATWAIAERVVLALVLEPATLQAKPFCGIRFHKAAAFEMIVGHHVLLSFFAAFASCCISTRNADKGPPFPNSLSGTVLGAGGSIAMMRTMSSYLILALIM